MDEVESPQTPVELLFILKMLADKKVPAQTIAPKFTGRFNKGSITWVISTGSPGSSRRTCWLSTSR